jgi:nickel/cobalt exporter
MAPALSSLKENPAGIWLLLGLSFAYGVFHAVGHGHGKAVISSYLCRAIPLD